MNRTKVRRRVLACARCRKRKLMCDGKVPACTRCVDANVACVGFDSSTQKEAPRSIADFLEAHIATLSTSPASPTAMRMPVRPGPSTAAFPSPAASHQSDAHAAWAPGRSTYADRLVNQAMTDITPSFLGISKMRPLLTCVVKGTQLPSKKGPVGSTDLDENHPRSIINPQTATSWLDGIDRKTASSLFNNYLERVITQYPIYHRNHVTAAFNAIYAPIPTPNLVTSRDRYIVSIIMAISLSTAARTKQKKANALAYTLVRQAMQYIPDVATNDIAGLQAILLLTQYIFLNPSMADLWLLTGLISQAVIDLGLHQELPNDPAVTEYERDLRRRLFWCAWEMEVGVCCVFTRPINLPIRKIDIPFPFEVDDTAITKTRIDLSGRVTKFTSRWICLFRLIEADIFSVMWHGEPIPADCPSIDHWKQRCHTAILEWQRDIYAAADANQDPSFDERWKEMTLYSDIAVPYIFVALYRPTRLIPNPSTEQLVTAFENAVRVADGYWQQANANFGRIKYVFHPCHHVFNCALVFLQALQRCPQEIYEQHPWHKIEDWMDRFVRCFSAIAERWTAATRCLEEYKRLLAPIKQEYTEFLTQRATFLQPRPSEPTVESDYTYANPELDEAFNYWTVFNPTTTADAADSLSAISHNHINDWAAEFNLDFAPIPTVDQKLFPMAPR